MGGTYDRPVARRIAEERGVPRELFGQNKLNTTIAFPKPTMPITKELRKEYLDFLDRENLLPKWKHLFFPVIHRLNEILYYRSPKRYVFAFYFLYYLERGVKLITRRPFRFGILWEELAGSVYCFSVNRVSQMVYSRCLPESENSD